MEPQVKYLATAASAFPINGRKHSIVIPSSSEAPVFHGKSSESPMQFLIRVQEYVKSVHLCDHLTLINSISQFLRETALEWYCQLRMSHRRPQTWEQFTELFLAQFHPPIREARQEAEWYECKQKEGETINEFLVRLWALWREQKPNEAETDLVKHLLCRIRNDLFNMLRISRNASLDEIIAEAQQVEDILYCRAKHERLSNQLKQLSFQKTKTLPNSRYNEDYSHKTKPELSNKYVLNRNVAAPSHYLNNQVQRTVDTNTPEQLKSYGCHSCGRYIHLAKSCPTQYGNYRQIRSKPNPEKRQRNSVQKDQLRFCVNSSVESFTQLHTLEAYRHINMNTQCIFCNISCTGYCCSQCSEMSRGLKFKRLLQLLEKCSESVMYYDEINLVVQRIQQTQSLIVPFEFHPVQVFDATKHVVDLVAQEYLGKAANDVHHLLPVDVVGNGNCLYNSILLLMNNSSVTTDELRVRTLIELTANENYYHTMYSQYVGPSDIAIKSVCKNHTFSELYEIAALCNVLQCNIRSVYPKIDFQYYMALWDSVLTSSPTCYR